MSVKTQGTKLWFIDPSLTPEVATDFQTMSCPTGITGLGGAADQIDSTCLDDTTDRSFVAGLGNPGQVSVPFVFKPGEASQRGLFALKDSGASISWLIGLSDGTAPPTVAANAFVVPTTRTTIGFTAYVADVSLDIATNEVVRGTLTLQRSGAVVPTFKA